MLRAPAAAFVEEEFLIPKASGQNGRLIHHTATIGKNVRLGNNVKIDAFAVIDENVEIGDNSVVGAYVYVGPMVTIGEDTILHPHVTLRDQVRIGSNVTINSGSIIGSDGFGFANNGGVNHKIPQVGIVEIEDDAWIGANVTIDRATIGTTLIKRGARIDNLAQIGHNVVIGEDTVIRPQVGVAGSTTIGTGCEIGEKVGVTGHINIGDNVVVHAFSAIFKGLDSGENVMGLPAKPVENEKSIQDHLRDLPNIIHEFQRLKKKLGV